MFNALCIILLFCNKVKCYNFMNDIEFIINNYILNDLSSYFILTNNTIEPTVEPTYFISIPSYKPSFQPSINPSYTSSFKPSFMPTVIDNKPVNKILKFKIVFEMRNYTEYKLNENDKDIVIYSFAEILETDKEYLTFINNNIRRRKLFTDSLNESIYKLQETILVSIPFINNYRSYESIEFELYNLLVFKIKDSINLGILCEKVQEYAVIYNSVSFNNIEITLDSISAYEVIILHKNNNNNYSFKKFKKFIILSIVSGILFVVLCYNIYKYECKYIFRLFNTEIKIHNSQTEEFTIINSYINSEEVKNNSLVEEYRIVETTL